MAEPKAKTQLELFGFKDPDIHKHEHDEMIRWIDINIQDILMLVLQLATRPTVKTWMEAVVERGTRQLGHVDLHVFYTCGRDHRQCCIEAKTKIETFGALLRQIRFYQCGSLGESPVSQMPFIVISPDDSFAEILRGQSVRFLKYDKDMSFNFLGGV